MLTLVIDGPIENHCKHIEIVFFLLSFFSEMIVYLAYRQVWDNVDQGYSLFFHESRTDRTKSIGEPLLPQSIKSYI